MKVLIDTNLLVRLDDQAHATHAEAVAAIGVLKANGHECVLVPQVLYEYWVVATRPIQVNGLGMDIALAEQAIDEWMALFRVLLDERGIFVRWKSLVATYQVRGKTAHDTRLVAAMQRHGVSSLLTFNGPDFARFQAIQVYSPAEILGGRLTI